MKIANGSNADALAEVAHAIVSVIPAENEGDFGFALGVGDER